MDDAERMAWDEAVERATRLDAPATVEVPSDVLIAGFFLGVLYRSGRDAPR